MSAGNMRIGCEFFEWYNLLLNVCDKKNCHNIVDGSRWIEA